MQKTAQQAQFQYISASSNCSVPFKKLKHLKTHSPNKSFDNKNRCKEVNIEVAKFLQKINKNESNLTSMKSSGLEPKHSEEFHSETKPQTQNQLLSKQLELKQQEIEMWKQKYEQVSNQMHDMKNKYDEDIKILSKEIEAVNERITSCEHQRNQSFFEQKATNLSNVSIQTFQRSFNENDNMIEQNQLLDEISEKNHTIQQLTHMIEKLQMEASENQLQSNNEIEQLKNKISQIQLENQVASQQVRSKMDFFAETQLINQRSAYHNQIEILKEEIHQLKGLIDIKNQEVISISNQNNKLKYQVDFEKSVLKQDIETFKMQLSLKEQQYQEDIIMLKENLEKMHKNEINLIKEQQEKQNFVLETEIKNLKELLSANNTEQQHLILEKLLQKEFYLVENQRLNNLVDEQNRRLQSQRQNTESTLGEKIQKISELQNQYQQLLDESNRRIEQLSQQNLNLKNQLNQQELELNKFDTIYLKLRDYEDNLLKLEQENKLIISHFEKTEKQRQKEKEQQIFQLEQYYEDQLHQQKFQIQTLINEKRKCMQIIEQKNQECYDMNIELKNLQLSISNIRIDNELLFSKLVTINNQESQRMSSDLLNNSVQFKRMSDQIGLLQNELMQKNKELTHMIEKYQNVEQNLCKSQIKQTEINLNELMRKQIRKSSQILYQ